MEWLTVKNWDKFQRYRRDRGVPPWVSLHRSLHTDPEWINLTSEQRGWLADIWMLAAARHGKFPADPLMVRTLCGMKSTPKLTSLKHFINQPCPTVDVHCQSDGQPLDVQRTASGRPIAVHSSTYKPLVKSKGFDLFWEAWPNKVKKKPARAAWKTHNLEPLTERIVSHVKERVSKDKKWKPDRHGETFIPHPTTFLNNAGWEDEYETEKLAAAPPSAWSPTKTAVEQMENQYGSRLVKSVLSEQFTSENQFRQQCKILAMPA